VARLLIGLLLCVGCPGQVQVKGVLADQEGTVVLLDSGGESWRLVLSDDSKALSALAGCGVEVEGVRSGKRLVVADWHVYAAPDGSAPFVGLLRQYGSNLVVDDRNSGTQIVLEYDSAQDLAPHAGSTVMVMGYIVGPHVVRVVAWRVLLER